MLTPGAMLTNVAALGGAAVAPTTLNVAGTAIASGWGLYTDTSRTANRLYGAPAVTMTNGTVWCGLITGTDAYLKVVHTSSNTTGLVMVSVDGGAWTTPTRDGVLGEFPLFTGLAQGAHFVAVRYGTIYGNNGYMDTSGANVLRIVGASPSVVPVSSWGNMGEASANTFSATSLMAYGTATYLPAKIGAGAFAVGVQVNSATIAVRHNGTEMVVASPDRYVYVSIDGAAPTQYDQNGQGSSLVRATRITGLSGTHTYYVWAGGNGYLLGVGVTGGTISNIADKRRLLQFGDSITFGASATSSGTTDEMLVAPALGMLGGNFGKSGDTVGGLEARMDSILTGLTLTSRDVAVIAIGRNDVGAWTASQTTSYQNIVNKLLAAGIGKIICRGILNTGVNYTTENGFIAGVVTSTADPKVVFLDTSAWSGIATADGTHPTDAGYVTIRNYAVTAYAALIPA